MLELCNNNNKSIIMIKITVMIMYMSTIATYTIIIIGYYLIKFLCHLEVARKPYLK